VKTPAKPDNADKSTIWYGVQGFVMARTKPILEIISEIPLTKGG